MDTIPKRTIKEIQKHIPGEILGGIPDTTTEVISEENPEGISEVVNSGIPEEVLETLRNLITGILEKSQKEFLGAF